LTTYGSTSSSHTCSTGYQGTASEIICLSTGSWSDSTGCTIRDCGVPSQTGYTFTTSGTTYDSVSINQACAIAYQGTASQISCTSNGIWSNSSGCSLTSNYCSAQPSQTGYAIGSGSQYLGAERTVSCAAGYTGSATSITCQLVDVNNGAWTASSGCTIRNCGTPIANAGYALGSGSTTYQSEYSMTCSTGYSGSPSSLTCTSDGTWTEQSGCTLIPNFCSATPTQIGYTISGTSQSLGATRNVSCATGYTGIASSITCTSNTTWTVSTGCTIVNCNNPSAQTGYVTNCSSCLTTYNSAYNMACASGYSGTASSITCQSTGLWTTSTGCNADCLASPTQTGYTIATGSSTHGSTRTVTCATGYTGTAASVLCTNGTWSPSSGCTIVSCSTTPPTQTGYTIASGASTYQSTRTVSCATGYFGSAAPITCQADSFWSAPSGCTIVSCTTSPTQSEYIIGAGDSTYLSIRAVSCASGYEGTASSISCQASGVWTASSGCTIVSCPPTPTQTGYSFAPGTILSTVTITGALGQFSCASTLLVVGQTVTISGTLGGTGTISGYASSTTYYIISTNGSTTFTLSLTSNGSAISTTTGTPTGLTYTLATVLSSVSIVGAAGQFSCASTTLAVGQTVNISGTLSGSGAISGYANPTTYYIIATNGSTTFTLSTSSTGSGVTTTSGTPSGLLYTCSTSIYLSTRTASCATGYSGSNASSVTCQSNKSWTLSSGCTIVSCSPTNPSQTGYTFAAGTSTYQSTRTYTCATGYIGTCGSPVTCGSNQAWSLATGCVVDCGTPAADSMYVISAGTLSSVSITGTGGQFSCASTTLAVGQTVTISGSLGGSGTISGYASPTTYYIIVTNGSTTFTLSTLSNGSGVTTTAGTPTGLTYTLNGATATRSITCATGYSGNPPSITCSSSTSTWSAPSGCSILSCNNPNSIPAGYSVATGGNTYSSSRVISCLTGYMGRSTFEPYSLFCLCTGTVANSCDWTQCYSSSSCTPSILSTVTITGTGGQFSCASTTLAVGQTVTISGSLGGSGTISGYANPTTYYIIATNGSTTFTLSTSSNGSGVATTAGTPTGLTYAVAASVWSPSVLACVATTCPSTSVPNSMSYSSANSLTGTTTQTVVVTCNSGYGASPGSLSNVSITGTAGQFSCSSTTLANGQTVTISGSLSGSGTILGYVNPTTYYIISTNGSTTFTLSSTSSGMTGVTTTTGTPIGLTYSLGATTSSFSASCVGSGTSSSWSNMQSCTELCTGGCNQNGVTTSGYCTGTPSSFSCVCPTNYAGHRCQYSRAVTCNNHGSPLSDGTCTCDNFYLGPNCMSCVAGINNSSYVTGSGILSTVAITGTAGQFSCTSTTLAVGHIITISGTIGGTGSISGYANPTTYYIISTNGSSTFTLSKTQTGSGVTTTTGTPTGLTYVLAGCTIGAGCVNTCPACGSNCICSSRTLACWTDQVGSPGDINQVSMCLSPSTVAQWSGRSAQCTRSCTDVCSACNSGYYLSSSQCYLCPTCQTANTKPCLSGTCDCNSNAVGTQCQYTLATQCSNRASAIGLLASLTARFTLTCSSSGTVAINLQFQNDVSFTISGTSPVSGTRSINKVAVKV